MSHMEFMQISGLAGILLVIGNLWFFFRVLRPIRRLSLQAEQLTQGDLQAFEQDCGGIPEIQRLRIAMSSMVGHVRRAQQQSRAYAERLADSQEIERKRLAHELHDDTLQSIIAISQSIDIAKNFLPGKPESALNMLQMARSQALEAVTGLRNVIGGLRPPALDELGLVTALNMLKDKFISPLVHITVEGTERRLDETRELALFRAAQEALNNVCRHSAADRVELRVYYQPERVTLSVTDNGSGFNPPSDLGDLAAGNHFGLLGIQERAQQLGGSLKLQQIAPGKGMRLEVTLPTTYRSQPQNMVRDPVCSALIEPQRAYASIDYQGETYYFCCPVCQGAFQKDPELYLQADAISTP